MDQNPAAAAPADPLARLVSYLRQDPDNLNLLAEIADLALERGDVKLARDSVTHALELAPDSPYFKLRLSSTRIAERDFGGACAVTDELIAQGHVDVAVLFNHAYALMSAGRVEEARDMLRQANAQHSEHANLVRLLIRAHQHLAELDQAIEVATRYLEYDPGNADIRGLLSLLYVDTDRIDEAREAAHRALANMPAHLDALLAASTAALAAEDGAAARAHAAAALQLQPVNGRAWENLGLVDMLGFDIEAARDKFEKAAAYMPGHIGTWHLLGWTEFLLKNFDAAERCFQKAVEIDDSFGETQGALAAMAAMRGEWEKADEYAKVARRLDPGSMTTYFPQVLRLQREGKSDAAARIIDRALRQGKAPGGGSYADMLQRMLAARQR